MPKYHITVETDTDEHHNPRKAFDNFGTMVCYSDKYRLGDVRPDVSQEEYRLQLLQEHYGMYDDELENITDLSAADALFDRTFLHMPLYVYDHGRLLLSVGAFEDRFDSRKLGFIYVTRESARKEFGDDYEDKAKDLFRGEVETYHMFLNDYVYFIQVKEPRTCEHCLHTEYEDIDSIGGVFSANIEDTLPSILAEHFGIDMADVAYVDLP